MVKDRILLTTSVLSLFAGYFVYDYILKVSPDYSIISIVFTFLISLGVFSLSNKGKSFWSFFGETRKEFSKIYFPAFKEVMEGFVVVLVFCSVAMAIIWLLDGVFLNIYNSLMVK